MDKVYPSWRYHKSNEAVIINSEAEEKELGKGWTDSPVAEVESESEEAIEVVLKEEPKPKRQAKEKQ